MSNISYRRHRFPPEIIQHVTDKLPGAVTFDRLSRNESKGSHCSGGAHRVLPYGHRVVAELPHRFAGVQVALGIEGVVKGGADGEKALR